MTFRVCMFLATFWIAGALPFELPAQTQSHLSRRYTMNDGLPENAVNCVLQDMRGFIWVGSYHGLSRFDGYKFTTYKHNPASRTSLGHNRVNSMWEDRKGRLWVAHMKGVDLFDPQTETFQSLGPDTVAADIGAAKFRERRDGKLWICSQGIYIADPETLSLQKMTGLPDDGYWDIVETKNSIWAAGTRSVVHIDGKTRQTSIYKPDPLERFGSASFTIHIDDQEQVWIGSNGLYRYNPESKSFTGFLQTNNVRHVVGNSDGNLLVGHGHGLFSFDPRTNRYDTIAKGWSTSILTDRQGIMWHSTLRGLNQINPDHAKFRSITRYGNVWSIERDGNQNIWMGASRGLVTLDPTFREVLKQQRLFDRGGHGSGPLSFMGADNEGSIYFTRSPNRFIKYDFRTKSISLEQIMPVRDEYVISLFVDSFGHAWLGRWNGVTKYNPKTNSVEQLSDFPGGTVHCFLEDPYKNLWIGSAKGLVRYNLTTGELIHLTNDQRDHNSLSDNTVYNLAMDSAGNIWVGTGRGINKITKGTENGKPQFTSWTTASSDLPNDDVYCIVDGGDGTLWLACGNMVSHFNPSKSYFRNYDRSNGLPGAVFRNAQYIGGRGLRTVDGKIIFGTNSAGVVMFHPDSLVDNSYIPPVVITDFLIGNQRVPITDSEGDTLKWRSPLEKDISFTHDVKLAHKQNDFSFEFAALNFINPENNQYKYKLEPYETEWIETPASNRVARYTNIDPGIYTFRVIGSNNDGVWNEEGATLLIIIAPPWWQTWWAYSLYGVALIAIFLYWRTFENKRIKLKHRAEHLSELDTLKTKFFANISHEFRTPITLILGPLRELYDGTFKGDQKPVYGTMMRNGQRLLRLINQLLELSKLEAGKMRVHPVSTDLVEFIREIAASYESLAKDKAIKYFFYPEVSEVNAYIDPEKIEKVIHNLLSNAFKFTKEGGEIILYLKIEKARAMISVKDTGVGIPSDQIPKIFDRFFQVDSSQTRKYEGSGLGMAIAKELVELHDGKIAVESVEGKGTTFTVWLPMAGDHLKDEETSGSLKRESSISLQPEVPMRSEALNANGGEQLTPITSEEHPVVLIVEDNSDMRQYIRRTLSEFYHLSEAANGRAGVEKAQEIIPDLIISDIMMPEMDGYKLCKLIKTNELTSHIPVILLTAKADRDSKLAGLETGADDYLSKPFDAAELKLIVRNRIDERRKLREKFAKEITLEPRQISVTSLDEKFLTKVLSIIEGRLEDENFSIDELSREAGYSNMHFYRKIKALTGQTPSQFLRTIRLKRAAVLLSRNSDNVTQIAYSVGFSSLSYFNKCFKEQFGVTPGQYQDPSTSDAARTV
ncbi:MAG: ATP-binding protein [Cyclobacteriaceae bacterium]